MTPRKGEGARQDDPAAVAEDAPRDQDSHGNDIKRVPGPGPRDEGKGAAGEEQVDHLKRR